MAGVGSAGVVVLIIIVRIIIGISARTVVHSVVDSATGTTGTQQTPVGPNGKPLRVNPVYESRFRQAIDLAGRMCQVLESIQDGPSWEAARPQVPRDLQSARSDQKGARGDGAERR